jgi:hypothetical protein
LTWRYQRQNTRTNKLNKTSFIGEDFTELSKPHQWFIGKKSKRTIFSDEPGSNIPSIVFVIHPAFASLYCQFYSVCYVDSLDVVSVAVEESLVDGLCQGTDDVLIGIHCSECDSGFVQVNSDERSEVDSCYIPAFSNSLLLCSFNFFHNKIPKKGLVK